jgi:hypothetical protein
LAHHTVRKRRDGLSGQFIVGFDEFCFAHNV